MSDAEFPDLVRPGPPTFLPEAITDRLNECAECQHFTNEHGSEGCLGSVEPTVDNDFDDQCPCMASPHTIHVRALEAAATWGASGL